MGVRLPDWWDYPARAASTVTSGAPTRSSCRGWRAAAARPWLSTRPGRPGTGWCRAGCRAAGRAGAGRHTNRAC